MKIERRKRNANTPTPSIILCWLEKLSSILPSTELDWNTETGAWATSDSSYVMGMPGEDTKPCCQAKVLEHLADEFFIRRTKVRTILSMKIRLSSTPGKYMVLHEANPRSCTTHSLSQGARLISWAIASLRAATTSLCECLHLDERSVHPGYKSSAVEPGNCPMTFAERSWTSV